MATVTIDVTAEDIRRGRRFDPYACPIARAVRRRVKGRVSAGLGQISVRSWPRVWLAGGTLPMPEGVPEFIEAFDAHRPVSPFRFRLKVPAAYRKD